MALELQVGAEAAERWRTRALAATALATGLAIALAIALRSALPAAAETAAPASRGDAPAPARTAPAPPREVRIVAVGDLTFGVTPSLPPGGAAELLAGLRPVLRRADVALGNLETPLTDSAASKCSAGSTGCYAFRAPPEYANDLRRTGFTILNLANNHANDAGAVGLADTVAALEAARLPHTGLPGQVTTLRAGRTRVALVGFAPYPWAQDLLDIAGAQALVARAAREADLVVVTMHAGAEGSDRMHVTPGAETYLGEPRGDPIAFAHAVVDAGADLVVGHGPHVLRGLEWYRGRLIAYSLGNASGHHTLSTSGVLGVTAALDVTLRGDGRWRGGRLVSLRLLDAGRPALDDARAARDLVADLSREDFGPRSAALSPRGQILAPRPATRAGAGCASLGRRRNARAAQAVGEVLVGRVVAGLAATLGRALERAHDRPDALEAARLVDRADAVAQAHRTRRAGVVGDDVARCAVDALLAPGGGEAADRPDPHRDPGA